MLPPDNMEETFFQFLVSMVSMGNPWHSLVYATLFQYTCLHVVLSSVCVKSFSYKNTADDINGPLR